MKKLLVLAVLVAAGLLAYRYVWATPERRVCSRMASLCDSKDEADQCQRDIAEFRKMASDDDVAKLTSCVAESQSCGEVVGCTAGAYGKVGVRALGDVFKGLGRSLSDK